MVKAPCNIAFLYNMKDVTSIFYMRKYRKNEASRLIVLE